VVLETRWDQHFDRVTQQLFTVVPEHDLNLPVYEDDRSFRIDDHLSVWRIFNELSKLLF